MATRTYLIFKENNKEVLNTQIFGNNFWDSTFFNEITKLAGKVYFPEGRELEVPFEEVFKLMEDVLVREIDQHPTKLIEKCDFDNYIFENGFVNPMLNFTDNFISRDDKTSEEPNETIKIDINTSLSSKVDFVIRFGKIFQTYNLIKKLEECNLLKSKNPVRSYARPVLKDGTKCFIAQY